METVGKRIKELRTALGMSQVDFAEKIGVTKQTLYKYENGLITNIPSDKIEAAAKAGNIPPACLMGWIPDEAEKYMRQIDAQLDQEELLQKLCELHKIDIHGDMNYLYITFQNGQKYAITHEDWKIISMKFPRLFEDVISLVDKFPMLLTSTNNQKEAQTESPN
jgi:transcriptional regulator with XRE-family HTH domain